MFIDIETVPGSASFDTLEPSLQELWEKSQNNSGHPNRTPVMCMAEPAYIPNSGKIICISVGMIKGGIKVRASG